VIVLHIREIGRRSEMRMHTPTVIVLGIVLVTTATSISANAQSMGFKHVNAYDSVHVHTGYYDDAVRQAPVINTPAQVQMVQYVRCIGGYEYVMTAPYIRGVPSYETCPLVLQSPNHDAAYAPEVSPFPRRDPRYAATPSRGVSPSYTAFTVEASAIGGATIAGASIPAYVSSERRQERRHAVQPRAMKRAADATARHVAKRVLIRAIPVVGTAVLAYELVGLLD